MTTKFNKRNFAELFRADYKTVSVVFTGTSNGSQYTYKVPKSTEVKPGDCVYVPAPDSVSTPSALKRAVVKEVHEQPEIESDASFEYKWIIGTSDDVLKEYEGNVARDKKLRGAVAKLEKAMERVALQTQLKLAMDLLDEDELKDIREAFGDDMPKLDAPQDK